MANILLINLAKKYGVDKLILISSIGITRPYHIASYILNSLVSNVFFWKAKTENYLRQSGLDYIIIRPGGLLGDIKSSHLHQCDISQGD